MGERLRRLAHIHTGVISTLFQNPGRKPPKLVQVLDRSLAAERARAMLIERQ
jgi:hypothetical protein